MITYYSSVENIIKNKQCNKAYALLIGGYLIKHFTTLDKFYILRIEHIKLLKKINISV